MVMKNSTMKYSNRMGQKTGMSKISKKVMKNDMNTDRMHEYQNLNSGNLLANGLVALNQSEYCSMHILK